MRAAGDVSRVACCVFCVSCAASRARAAGTTRENAGAVKKRNNVPNTGEKAGQLTNVRTQKDCRRFFDLALAQPGSAWMTGQVIRVDGGEDILA